MRNWIRALYLDERIALLHNVDDPLRGEYVEQSNHADGRLWDELAVARYIREGVLNEEEAYAPLGLNRDSLRSLLHLSSSELYKRLESPEWVQEIEFWKKLGADMDSSDDPNATTFADLALPVWSLFGQELSGFWSHFRKNLLNYSTIKPASENSLFKSLGNSLPMAELNTAVMPSVVEFTQTACGSEGEPNDDNGALVFTEAERLQFIDTYPVVYRQLHVILDKWRRYVEEILEALSRDLPSLDQLEFLDLGGQLPEIEIQLSKGDTHEYGKSVAQVSINGQKVFFKPYPPYGKQCLEVVSNVLGEALNGVECVPYLDRGTYFWEKNVKQSLSKECLSSTARALGSFSALTSVLGGNDFHYENIFFSDGKIVPVDLETLLHPSVAKTDKREDPNLEVLDYFKSSIATKGVIPFTMVSSADHSKKQYGVDISVLGVPPEQPAAVTVPYVSHAANGALQLKFERPLMTDDSGVTGRQTLLQYEEDFLEGYEATFKKILENRQDLLNALEALPNLAMRYVARPTMLYNKVLLESFHPEFTKDSMDRLACLYKLGTGFIGEDDRSEKIRAELSCLEVGDIPRFNSNLHDGIVWSQFCGISGRTRPLLEDLRKRLRTMDPREVRFVRSLVNHSFRLPEPARSFSSRHLDLGLTVSEQNGKLDYELLAKSLVSKMVDSFGTSPAGHVVALEMTAVTENIWTLTPAGYGLYNGLSGIAFALIAAYEITNIIQYRELAEQILTDCANSADLLIQDLKNGVAKAGTLDFGFYGVSGGLLFCCYLASHYKLGGPSEDWRERYEHLLNLVTKEALSTDQDIEIDVVAGLSGTILMILTTMQVGSESVIQVLPKLTERLVKLTRSAFVDANGSHLTPDDDRLLGFAHGSDGILYSLSRVVHHLSGQVQIETLEIIKLLFSWEFEVVKKSEYKWPDFRESSNNTDFTMATWCHGAPGAMIAMKQLERNDLIEAETISKASQLAAIAEEQTLLSLRDHHEQFAKEGHSLCHSKLSNAFIARKLASTHKQKIFDRIFYQELDELAKHGWVGGAIPGVKSQGLMTGLAGTLIMIADSVDPGAFPDVLCP